MRAAVMALTVSAAVVAMTGSAYAQTAGGAPTPPTENAGPVATVRNENGHRVYVATGTIEVRGEIQRPYAFSLSGRSSLGYTYLDVPVHFVQEILDAVRRAPF